MAPKAEQLKQDLIERVVGLVRERLDRARSPGLEAFVRRYYENVPPQDMLGQSPDTLFGAALALWSFARQRKPGEAKVRAYNPRFDEHGWTSEHTVVEIVNDDMPFLVDSVTAEMTERGIPVHVVIHPLIPVTRDAQGRLDESATSGPLIESMMHVEIGQQTDPALLDSLKDGLIAVLGQVRSAVSDWSAMRARTLDIVQDLDPAKLPLDPGDVEEAKAFLQWLHDDNFTFLGYREHDLSLGRGETPSVRVREEAGLGVARNPDFVVFDELRHLEAMPPEVLAFLRAPRLLLIGKANRKAQIHRAVPMDLIGVKRFDAKGRVVGLRMLVGLFTSAAYNRNPRSIPLLRRKVESTLTRAGFPPASHDGKALLNILETYPRDELFQISEDLLYETALGILHLQERQRVALFVRRDDFERFMSCLVFVPRDRYDTRLRHVIQSLLEEAFRGTASTFSAQVSDSPLARLNLLIKTTPGAIPEFDIGALEERITEAARSWSDLLEEQLVAEHGEERGLRLSRRYSDAFPAAYRERFPTSAATFDIAKIESMLAAGGLAMNLYRPLGAPDSEVRFKIYHPRTAVPLSDVLPMLEHLGLKVIDELPFEVHPRASAFRTPAEKVLIHDFGLISGDGGDIDLSVVRPLFEDAFARVWSGEAEDDGFNRLVLRAGLGWREVMVLRAYAKYLQQAGILFSQAYMAETLARHARTARLLARLFLVRFDPTAAEGREEKAAALLAEIAAALDAISNPDEDRILRRFLNLIEATLRTNYFQTGTDGLPKSYLALKLASRQIDELPLPRPWVETWVYSPRVEAVHLRGGKVARGGIRWSDRREDFRTEILGLLKAQMVKNAVIVPVGAKGGFVVKRPPAPEAGREAFLAEGVECYKTFMRGLLDLADNLVGGEIVPPRKVVRRDDDDPYLVVAADKGTATFSDIANGISDEYGFWLSDAFASGGSQGYDHKAMGITARGAWVSVQRHFREMGMDVQGQDFTVVGVGDMSGDVFGNGMLRSNHIKLVGAFDHRHVFVDPDPDPVVSFAERERLFVTPRSSWADYDPKLISPGGAVFDRQAKTVKLTPQIQQRFGIETDIVTPAELIRALLTASVDLLWFGGIGTYVKAAAETNADAGDRANDAVRVDANRLRAKVVGEGANLAVTQRGRIEYALGGGRINTDAIDNSAGVDTSDHEVNIKILLRGVVEDGDITLKQRNALLADMTEEVAALVLRDNYLQTQALTLMTIQGAEALDPQVRLMRMLERSGRLNRAIEFLPDEEEIARRAQAGLALTRPESAVLLAYSKIWLYDELLGSDLPDDPRLFEDLLRYFPAPLQERFREPIGRHRLRREIIATNVTNSMINRVGGTFVTQMAERTGAPAPDVARAYAVSREVFQLREMWEAIEGLDSQVASGEIAADVQADMMLETVRLADRGTLWFLRNCPQPVDIGAVLNEYCEGVDAVADGLADFATADVATIIEERAQGFVAAGVPRDLARRVASLVTLGSAPDIVRIARTLEQPVSSVGPVYFTVGERLGLAWLRTAAERIPPQSHWHKLALGAIVEDLYIHQRAITLDVLNEAPEAKTARAKSRAVAGTLDSWIERNRRALDRVEQLIAEMRTGTVDLAVLAVANRQLRALTER